MTQQEIINRARDLLEAVIEGREDPTWTSEMFVNWCQDGNESLILRIKNDLLDFLYTISLTILTPGEQILDGNFLKLVKVTRAGKICTIKNIKTTNNFFLPTAEFPTVYRIGNKIIIEPVTAPATVEVIYIRKPNFILNEESELPRNWQDGIINFICVKALEKDKKFDTARYYLDLFNGIIEVINKS